MLYEFQRIKCICDSEDVFDKNAQDMIQRFKKRGYKHKTLDKAYSRVKEISREQLLVQKQRQQQVPNQVYFVTQYSSQANKIKQIIKKNWDIIKSDTILRDALPEVPTITFKRAPTLKDSLVKSYMPPVQNKTWLGTKRGNYKCGNCNHCNNMVKTNTFIDVTSNREYSIYSFINCNTSFVVYRLECPCGCFYIGRTKRKLKERLAEHKYAIRTSNQ